MASISGTVTIAGDPDDWIATAFDADTHAFAGVAAVSSGTYEITGLTAGKAYVVACRPKSGGAWLASYAAYAVNDYAVTTNPGSTPYLFKATAVTGGDEYYNNVQLLLKMNGADGSTTFTDEKSHSVSRLGNAQIDTAESKFGGASGLFDGTGDYLTVADSADFDMAGDFTVETWFRKATTGTGTMALFKIPAIDASGLVLRVYNGKLEFISTAGGTKTGATTVTNLEWHHVALVRTGSTVKFFLNGAQQSTDTTISGTISPVSTGIFIAATDYSGSSAFNGHLDDFRWTVGTARYTTTFTPPTTEASTTLAEPTGSTEPAWPTSLDGTVTDGGVTWKNMGQLVRPLMHGPLIAA